MGEPNQRDNFHSKGLMILAIFGFILGAAIILVTLEISHRNIIPFVVAQEKYIISVEAAFWGVFLVEVLVRILSNNFGKPEATDYVVRLKIAVRVVGYLIAFISIISIIASNPVFTISLGATIGVIIAFATQNIAGSILAAILILNTRIVRIGEEVTVSNITGTVADINLIHTIISTGDEVVFIPNSVIMSTAIRRKKRTGRHDHGISPW